LKSNAGIKSVLFKGFSYFTFFNRIICNITTITGNTARTKYKVPLIPIPIKKSINPYKRLIIGDKIYFIILVFVIVNMKYATKTILIRIIKPFIF